MEEEEEKKNEEHTPEQLGYTCLEDSSSSEEEAGFQDALAAKGLDKCHLNDLALESATDERPDARNEWLKNELAYLDEERGKRGKMLDKRTSENTDSYWGTNTVLNEEKQRIIRDTMKKIAFPTPEWAVGLEDVQLDQIVQNILEKRKEEQEKRPS